MYLQEGEFKSGYKRRVVSMYLQEGEFKSGYKRRGCFDVP